MITFLIDHNIEGQAKLLMETLTDAGWLELVPLQFVTFTDVALPVESSDRVIWRFAQAHEMIVLTDNRTMKDSDALECVMREENTSSSLPVLTIGNSRRLREREYRERCADRLAEIAFDLDSYRGIGRLFIP
jgi:hypothetical protein